MWAARPVYASERDMVTSGSFMHPLTPAMVGQNLGAGKPERGAAYAWASMWIGLLYWLVVLWRVGRVMSNRPTVRQGLALPEPEGGWPKLSIVIPVHDGERVIDNAVFFARLAQKLVHIVTTLTPAGTLYAASNAAKSLARTKHSPGAKVTAGSLGNNSSMAGSSGAGSVWPPRP